MGMHEHDEADEGRPPYGQEAPRRVGPTPLRAGLVGLLAGALLGGIVLSVIGGNPFSDANDVTYREVVVADISDDGDSLCWSTEPGRRDAPQECAILALDPAAAAPEEGERVTIGVVRLRTPDGQRMLQVVYARGSAPPAAEEGADDDGSTRES